jgi:hypothetical protein
MQQEESSAKFHAARMQSWLEGAIEDLRADIPKVAEPQLKAVMETSAEVLGGLARAFDDYRKKNEAAWRS